MSSKAEMSSGLTNGILQGYKSGFGFSRMESGFKKGLLNGIREHNKVQDPTVGLIGDKAPKFLWIADYTNTGGTYPPISGNAISSTDGPYELIGGGLMTAASNPVFRGNGVYYNKGYVDFASSADRVSTSTTIVGKSELTVVMVLRLSSILTGVLFQRGASSTVGDITISSIGGNKIRVTFTGSPSSTSSVYETYESTIAATENTSNGTNSNKWFILTVKFDLTQRNGNGSEMEIYINGVLNMTPVTTTFTGTTTAMSNLTVHYGNTTTQSNDVNYRCQIASSVYFDYWLNNTEQMKIENFYRYYYGHRF
jgi:hypothetical protein